MEATIGVVGLGTMGSNLALNLAENAGPVAVWNRRPEVAEELAAANEGLSIVVCRELSDLVGALAPPRRVLLMVPAGGPVDEVLENLVPLLDPGDTVIDGGNSHFQDSAMRERSMTAMELRFVGLGVSGGAEGARRGPALMPGGSPEAWEYLQPTLEAVAAKTDAGPCVGWLGPEGAGHLVKTVHNGIEYADMQCLAETYDLLARSVGLDAEDLASTFASWNEGPLGSYLVEITAEIFRARDAEGRPLVDLVLDRAGNKGTGRWTAEIALEAGLAVPTIAAALEARYLSSFAEDRVALAERSEQRAPEGVGEEWVGRLHDAMLCARLCSYAQGFHLLRVASDELEYGIDLAEVARIWKGGCIIRARVLDVVRRAYQEDEALDNPLFDDAFRAEIVRTEDALRDAVGLAVRSGRPVPALAASLTWLDAVRAAELPLNLTQAQRDAFGSHGIELRGDSEQRTVHAEWLGGA